jgi:hypothetical protein
LVLVFEDTDVDVVGGVGGEDDGGRGLGGLAGDLLDEVSGGGKLEEGGKGG